MKSSIIIVVLGLISAGYSNTTYLSLTEDDKGKVRKELNGFEKGNNVRAEVTISLFNGKEVEGELLSVRDNALIVCTEYAAKEQELAKSIYPIILIKNNVIQQMTIEGSSYVWAGIGIGYLTGFAIGGLVLPDVNTKRRKNLALIAGGAIGSLVDSIVGGVAGLALSKEEFILYEIPSGYNSYFLQELGCYVKKEPEYLRTIN